MEIIGLADEYVDTYCKCLEDWSEEIGEAGGLKREWYERKKPQGLRVKLARSEKGEIVGMIQYAPIEVAPALGQGLYYIYCVWVHGYRRGVGNQQGGGIGTALLAAAEADARALGAKGMAAWGLTLPFFMRSKWFKRRGYARADRLGTLELVWKRFAEEAEAPRLLRPRKRPEAGEGPLEVTCLRNGWCPGQNLACERMKRAALEAGDKVRYREIDTDERAALEEWGLSDAIFIGDKQINTGPPPSYERLRRLLARRLGRR